VPNPKTIKQRRDLDHPFSDDQWLRVKVESDQGEIYVFHIETDQRFIESFRLYFKI
jgi:hypothetical protein